jgi:chitosanase
MIPDNKKRLIQAIVNIFETDEPEGDYGNVTLIPGDSGGLTYGRSQTTLACGGLYKLLADYCSCAQPDITYVIFTRIIQRYLPQIQICDPAVNNAKDLIGALRFLGKDPLMRQVQDKFFDRQYWDPADHAAEVMDLTFPLSYAVVYDSFVHGSFNRVRRMFPEVPPAKRGDERSWTRAYVRARRGWLLTNQLGGRPYKADDACVYRMDEFIKLIQADNWDLTTPFIVRGHQLN